MLGCARECQGLPRSAWECLWCGVVSGRPESAWGYQRRVTCAIEYYGALECGMLGCAAECQGVQGSTRECKGLPRNARECTFLGRYAKSQFAK